MKRLNPIGSLPGFVLTILLFLGLGMSLLVNRGSAFSPGKVTGIVKEGLLLGGFSSHAAFEKECKYCHDPLKTDLANKCLDCHVRVRQQIETAQGVHSRVAGVDRCADCHPEHRGRSFNPTRAAYELFDHSRTNFSLNWHQQTYDTTPMECSDCHGGGAFVPVTNQVCLDCHATHDPEFKRVHLEDFGPGCLDCHDGADRMQKFDHQQVGFQLEAKHQQAQCTACHADGVVKNTPSACKDCHAEPSMHRGIFEADCAACHNPQGWSPVKLDGKTFSHMDNASFSLVLHEKDYSGNSITCLTCHPQDLTHLEKQTCIDCHSKQDEPFMTKHLEQFGTDCLTCHDGVDRLSNFEHANFFPLQGRHAEIECSDCHINNQFRGTSQECWQCHAEPEIHTGVFGLKCYYCHDAQAWSPATLKQHSFPINHGTEDSSQQLQCEACHGANYITYTCTNCHEHQAGEMVKSHSVLNISEPQLQECVQCHPDGKVSQNGSKP